MAPASLQTGGALWNDDALYIERDADRELFEALQNGELCYVLAPRQIGKSSLRVRTTRDLKAAEIFCATVDLTALGSKDVTLEQWYYGFCSELVDGLGITIELNEFWQSIAPLSPQGRFMRFLSEVVLAEVPQSIVLFVDEIDYLRVLEFGGDDFLSAIRATHDARGIGPHWKRLTWCLLGVATPRELITKQLQTPFNIGRPIHLEDFTQKEATALIPALSALPGSAEVWLTAIMKWTAGHPFMTMKLTKLLIDEGGHGEAEALVDALVERHFLRSGRHDDPSLAYAERRFTAYPLDESLNLLQLYFDLLRGERISVQSDAVVQQELRLTGIAARRQDEAGTFIQVRNRIYSSVFNEAWILMLQSGRLFSKELERWQRNQKDGADLLSGTRLEEAENWLKKAKQVTADEREFILASLQKRRKDTRDRVISYGIFTLLVFTCIGLFLRQLLINSEVQAAAVVQEAKQKEAKAILAANHTALMTEQAEIKLQQTKEILGQTETKRLNLEVEAKQFKKDAERAVAERKEALGMLQNRDFQINTCNSRIDITLNDLKKCKEINQINRDSLKNCQMQLSPKGRSNSSFQDKEMVAYAEYIKHLSNIVQGLKLFANQSSPDNLSFIAQNSLDLEISKVFRGGTSDFVKKLTVESSTRVVAVRDDIKSFPDLLAINNAGGEVSFYDFLHNKWVPHENVSDFDYYPLNQPCDLNLLRLFGIVARNQNFTMCKNEPVTLPAYHNNPLINARTNTSKRLAMTASSDGKLVFYNSQGNQPKMTFFLMAPVKPLLSAALFAGGNAVVALSPNGELWAFPATPVEFLNMACIILHDNEGLLRFAGIFSDYKKLNITCKKIPEQSSVLARFSIKGVSK